MINDNGFKAILKSLPPKPDRSKLEPYAKLILELHRRGRSFREIVQILSERCNFKTSRSTVNDFVRGRLKRIQKPSNERRPPTKGKLEYSGLLSGARQEIQSSVTEKELQIRISHLKEQPIKNETPPPQPFEYDPEQPLRLRPSSAKKY